MNFNELINKNYKTLNENDIHILKYIISNKEKVSNMRIEDLSDLCNISRTTILRLSKKLGFKGYSEFKTFLKWDIVSKQTIENNKIQEVERSFNETIMLLKSKNIDEMCEAIDKSNRVFVYGTGNAQEIFSEELKRLFLFHHKYLHVIKGEKELDVSIENFNESDLIIMVSHSGNSPFIQGRLHEIKLRRAKILSITTLESNYLASSADYSLYGYSATYNLVKNEEYNSSFFYFIILEMLFIRFSEYMINKEVKF